MEVGNAFHICSVYIFLRWSSEPTYETILTMKTMVEQIGDFLQVTLLMDVFYSSYRPFIRQNEIKESILSEEFWRLNCAVSKELSIYNRHVLSGYFTLGMAHY